MELVTLGPPLVRDADGPVRLPPKCFALLTYVACAEPAGVQRRDTLVAVFWPELDREHARNSLNQTLYQLRSALGPEVVESRGREELVRGEGLAVDALAFASRLEEGARVEALALYGGDFLEGFHVSGAPAFERWLDGERARLRRRATGAAVELARRARKAERPQHAARWLRRARDIAPTDERVASLLVEVLAAAGDRVAALRASRVFTDRLEAELGLAPSPAFVALTERIRSGEGPRQPLTWPPPGFAEGSARGAGARDRARADPYRTTRRLALFALALAIPGALLAGAWLTYGTIAADETGGGALDPSTVTVLPFRTSGARPSLAFLGEGMVDLLEAKLTGEGGPRAADARAVLSAWRKARPSRGASGAGRGIRVARELGTARLLTGSVVGNEDRLVLTAMIRDVASGEVRSRASVDGSLADLAGLVDRLAARLLAREAGAPAHRLAVLTTRSLPALRSYLRGQATYRSGRPDEALRAFTRAVELDSTFALAALRAHLASTWLRSGPPFDAMDLAWRHRDRLSPLDRTWLAAEIGPRYPAHSSGADRLAARETLTRERPEDPEAWFALGDLLVHFGAFQDIPDSAAIRRSTLAFERVLVLDSTFLPALVHLFDIARARGDTASARRHGTRYLELETSGLQASVIRNLLALQSRGLEALPRVVARTDSAGDEAARLTVMALHMGERTLPFTDSMINEIARRMPDPRISPGTGWLLYGLAMDRGRPAEAAGFLDVLSRTRSLDPLQRAAILVRDGLHYGGDPRLATRSSGEIEALVNGPSRSVSERARVESLCVLGQWRLARGGRDAATAVADRLRALVGDGEAFVDELARGCAQLLEAWRAVARDAPDARSLVARLDTFLAAGTMGAGRLRHEADLVTARLLERQGDLHGALRVLGRYPRYATGVQYRPTFLRERGRVAALLGDTAAAVDAYCRYLAIRADPEAALAPERDRIRERLEGLTSAESEPLRSAAGPPGCH